jgi:hypothetical protein
MKTECDLPESHAAVSATIEPRVSYGSRTQVEPAATFLPDLAEASAYSVAQLIELILKDRLRLNCLVQTDGRKLELASRLLAVALTSFALYGLAMWLTFFAARQWPQVASPARLFEGLETQLVTFVPAGSLGVRVVGRAAQLVIAYSVGLIAASGVCLPSLYFYGLLSGLRMTMSDVVVHTLKGCAVTAVALIGILPIYSALALGAIVLPVSHEIVSLILFLGLCLPFIAGLWGTWSLFLGFVELCHTMPPEFQANRACFLRRLMLSWCGCYTAIAPVMIVMIWRHLGS